jgi:hypothetical protein
VGRYWDDSGSLESAEFPISYHFLSKAIICYHGFGKRYDATVCLGNFFIMPARKRIPLHLMWIRGAIGKQFVIKHYRRRVVKTKFPDMTRIIASARQRKCRNLFAEAVLYAKAVIANPVQKAEWQKKIKRRNGVYNKAIKAFMLREKCAREREELLAAQQMRVAFKNETAGLKKDMLLPAKITGEKAIAAGYCFLETG